MRAIIKRINQVKKNKKEKRLEPDYVKPFGFHALRHFVATYLDDQEKVGSKTISTILRLQSEKTT